MDHVASLLLGLGNGGVFAALALALVLTYRSSGVINFATGAIALYVAYTYGSLRAGELLVPVPGLPKTVDVGGELGLFPAAAVALTVGALLGALLYLLVFRPLRDAPPLARAVASLGVLIVIESVMALRVGGEPVSVAAIFPEERWTLGSLTLLSDRLYLAAAVVALTIALTAAFRLTRFGLLTRAAAESQTGLYVSGGSPDRIALANWMISGTVAGAAGILIAPLSPLTPSNYTLFVVPALAAAVVGGFQHLLPTVAAGLAIGMVQAEALSLSADHDWLPESGLAELVPLLVILVALLTSRRGLPARGTLVRQPLGHAPRPRSLVLPTLAGTAVGVLALVLTDGTWRSAVIGTFIGAVIGLSVVVVTGYAGQVSLAQLSLAGCAAFTLSGLTSGWHIPFPIAPLLAALVATVIGVLVGLPALRLRGLTLGIVTLALAYAIEAVWFRNSDFVSSDGATVEPPTLFGLDLGIGSGHAFPRIPFGLLCLGVLVATAWGVARLRMSALGSAMLAVRANERSAAGIGIDVVRIKVISFALASFIAGLGGSLLAYRRGVVTFDSFSAIAGLTLLSTAYLAGVTSVYGGILAGVLGGSGITFVAMDRWIDLGDWFPVLSGLSVIGVLIGHPEGLAGGGQRLAARLRLGSWPRARARALPAPPDPSGSAEPLGDDAAVLEIEGLTVRYGGVLAVDGVSLRVEPGRIVGLIGPNGAGKTSVIDAVTGFAPAAGSVRLGDAHLEGLPPHRRVRRGLTRTFQALELYDDLTVEENVGAALSGVRGQERRRALDRALDLVGLADRADRPASALSHGERQLVSIARACAVDTRVLLLDEPAAGLDTTETAWLGERIRTISGSGVGVLLIDHDVSLVLGICDHVYVLDFGRLIAEGPPERIRADRAVMDAYLGRKDSPVDTEISNARRIRDLAAASPAEIAVRHVAADGTEAALTWAELDRRSSQLAGALAGRGLALGDRLGIGLRNSPQFVLAVLAAWKIGAVPVPVRWDVPEWELTRLREVINPRVHLGDADLAWIDATAALAVPDLPDAVSPQINGICSSGSTGTPKIILTDRPSVYDERLTTPFIAAWNPVSRPQTIGVLAPMYHANGLTTLYSLLAGDSLVVLEKFDAARVVDVVERHRVSTFTATPTMLQRIADLPGIEERDLSSLAWILQGAAPMPRSLVHRWAKLIGPERIVMAYGMTEGLGLTALRGDEWMAHEGSVGRPFRDTEVRVLDDDGQPLPPGEPGLIYLRSGMSAGYRYLGDAPPLRQTTEGFSTAGDLGHLDADGYLYVLDRRVDMIVSGGANVFPAEVEAALIDHPDIADVVVIGLRDPKWGRRVHAIIEPADPGQPPTADEIVSYARSRLAPYKVPKTVEVVEAIPRSAATKVNRGALVAARES